MGCSFTTYDEMQKTGSGQSGVPSRNGLQVQSGLSCIGNNYTDASFLLNKTGSPTGTVECAVYDSSGTKQVSLGTLDASTLTTSNVEYNFTDPDATYTCASGDRLVIDYSSGDSSNYIGFAINNAGGDTSNQIQALFVSPSWSTVSSRCVYFKLNEYVPPPETSSLLFPPPVAYI